MATSLNYQYLSAAGFNGSRVNNGAEDIPVSPPLKCEVPFTLNFNPI